MGYSIVTGWAYLQAFSRFDFEKQDGIMFFEVLPL